MKGTRRGLCVTGLQQISTRSKLPQYGVASHIFRTLSFADQKMQKWLGVIEAC